MTKREKLNGIAKEIENLLIEKYGTSEGATRAWDTRGRGRKASDKKESKQSKEDLLPSEPYTDTSVSELKPGDDILNKDNESQVIKTIKESEDGKYRLISYTNGKTEKWDSKEIVALRNPNYIPVEEEDIENRTDQRKPGTGTTGTRNFIHPRSSYSEYTKYPSARSQTETIVPKYRRAKNAIADVADYLIEKYGTSEGAMAAWDTRGRGRKSPEDFGASTRGGPGDQRPINERVTNAAQGGKASLNIEGLSPRVNASLSNIVTKYTNDVIKEAKQMGEKPSLSQEQFWQDMQEHALVQNALDKINEDLRGPSGIEDTIDDAISAYAKSRGVEYN